MQEILFHFSKNATCEHVLCPRKPLENFLFTLTSGHGMHLFNDIKVSTLESNCVRMRK